jgi:hypothetical protein
MKNLTFLVALSLAACGGSGHSATPAARAPAPITAPPPVAVAPPPVAVAPPPVAVAPPPVAVAPPPVAVAPPPVADLMVSWVAPTANTDGTPLTDLAGYHLHYGDTVIDIPDPLAVTYTVKNLTMGAWVLYMTAYNTEGVESDASVEVFVPITWFFELASWGMAMQPTLGTS